MNDELNKWLAAIEKFLVAKKFNILPLPAIVLNDKDNKINDVFISTGKYDYTTNTIVLFIGNRHIKDILRSFVHELIHHHQWLANREQYERLNKEGKISHNKELRKVEAEAYLLGNLYFRMFTEEFTM